MPKLPYPGQLSAPRHAWEHCAAGKVRRAMIAQVKPYINTFHESRTDKEGQQPGLRTSPYLCPWCRNGQSMNEAHENCLAGGRFDRFWPVEDVIINDVVLLPIRDLAAGKLSPQETRAIVYF